MSDVEYRAIAGFPGYRVGDDGSVWSSWAYNGRHPRRLSATWKRLIAQPDGDGYLALNLFRDGRACRRKVHLLVLESFVGARPDGMEGCHNDGAASNCVLSNLRWDTPAANQQDRLRHGTHARGERSAKAKLTESQVRQIKARIAAGDRGIDLAAAYGVSPSTIGEIKRGRLWGWLNG